MAPNEPFFALELPPLAEEVLEVMRQVPLSDRSHFAAQMRVSMAASVESRHGKLLSSSSPFDHSNAEPH